MRSSMPVTSPSRTVTRMAPSPSTRARARVCRSRTDGSATGATVEGPAGLGERPLARDAVRDHDADVATTLALHADAVRRQPRGAPVQQGAEHPEELPLVRRAAAQLDVDRHVRGG